MKIELEEFNVEIPYILEVTDEYNINGKIFSKAGEMLWSCKLMGLWKDEWLPFTKHNKLAWEMHSQGDYFQQAIHRYNDVIYKGKSFTALFHEVIRQNRSELAYIKNIYSTSSVEGLDMGYGFSTDSKEFWEKQVGNKLAKRLETEGRYQAILD